MGSPNVGERHGKLNPLDRKKSPNDKGGRNVNKINCDIMAGTSDNVMTSLKNIVKP